MWDETTAALATRVTARVSAAVFCVYLIVRARRGESPETAGAVRYALAAFAVAHTIHFSMVLSLTWASGGANITERGGWASALVTGALFYVALAFLYRQANGGAPRRTWWIALALWVAFAQAYLLRIGQSLLFLLLSALLVAALIAHLPGLRGPGQGRVRT